MVNYDLDTFQHLLLSWGVNAQLTIWLDLLILTLITLLLSFLSIIIGKPLINKVFSGLAGKTKTNFDDFLLSHKFFTRVAYLLPYIIFNRAIPVIFHEFEQWIMPAQKFADIFLIVIIFMITRAALFALRDFLKIQEHFKDKPVESFIQVIMIFLYVVAALVLFSLISGKSIVAFLTAMGAASAVLLLIFKDTILGFVASIQVATNDMVRIGDWITMSKYSADGSVVEINLATVKVQNWDKTITTIPTYYLISDSFTNWRGMQESGGRRIKRSIFIKISSIRHLSPEDIEKLARIDLISKYLNTRSKEIADYQRQQKFDKEVLVNGFNLTNIGAFRKYINEYIHAHPKTNKELTMMVRQLDPTITGIPIELYVFSSEIDWLLYEDIMGDIFDHLLASVKYFDLEVFESPASDDIRALGWKNGVETKAAPTAAETNEASKLGSEDKS